MLAKRLFKILIVDTSADHLMEKQLALNGYTVITASDGNEVIKLAKQHLPDIIVLDVVMPELDGIETCTELRNIESLKRAFIIFYTDRGEEYSQIAAYKAGADDYIIRPTSVKVILTRIKALLRRLKSPAEKPVSIGVELPMNLIVDRERYLIRRDNEEIILPRKEFELLALLCSSPRKVFSRQEIASAIWGAEMEAKNRTIDVHIRKLRERLGATSIIKTIKGIGYKIEF